MADYSKLRSKGNYSAANIRKMKAEGVEVPRTDTKAHYREDMAQTDRFQSTGRSKGKVPARYYKNFDRGAARSKRKARRK